MGAARYAALTIKVGGASAAIDVTSDLISFSIEDTIQNKKADCLEIMLDDASKRYRNTWYIEKGTQIEATLSTYNWNTPGDSQSRDFGLMWVDTVEMQLKPSQINIKATAVDPNLQKDGVGHSGSEGQTVAAQVSKQGAALSTATEGYSSSASATTQIGSDGLTTMQNDVNSQNTDANIKAGSTTSGVK